MTNEMHDILFIGDIHGAVDHVFDVVRQRSPKAVAFLGDLEPQADFPDWLPELQTLTTVRLIHGNHDTDSGEAYDRLFDPAIAPLNLHGRVEVVAGLRIAGLGGVFRGAIWFPKEDAGAAPAYTSERDYLSRCGKGNRWRGGLPLKHRSTIFPDAVERLARLRADVLISHEAPDCHGFGFAAITALARAMGVKWLFHGHHHTRQNYGDTVASLGFQAVNVGYREIADTSGTIIYQPPNDGASSVRMQSIAGKGDKTP